MPAASRPVASPAAPDPVRRPGDRARVRRLVARDLETLRPGEQRGWWLREALAAEPGVPCPPLA